MAADTNTDAKGNAEAGAEAFPTLTDADMAVMDGLGTRRPITVGEYLYREGDQTYDFMVVVSGAIDVVASDGRGGEETIVANHGAGKFLGELNLLSGMRVFVSARVVEAGEVIVIPVSDVNRAEQFYRKLTHDVGLFSGARGDDVGFCDTTLQVGDLWSPALVKALRSCQVFVALCSPTYFSRPSCGKEWMIFTKRLERIERGASGGPASSLIPLRWVPMTMSTVPSKSPRCVSATSLSLWNRDMARSTTGNWA